MTEQRPSPEHVDTRISDLQAPELRIKSLLFTNHSVIFLKQPKWTKSPSEEASPHVLLTALCTHNVTFQGIMNLASYSK